VTFQIGDWVISIYSIFPIFTAIIAISLLIRFAGFILRGIKRFFRFIAKPFKRSLSRNKWNETRDRIYKEAALKDAEREATKNRGQVTGGLNKDSSD